MIGHSSCIYRLMSISRKVDWLLPPTEYIVYHVMGHSAPPPSRVDGNHSGTLDSPIAVIQYPGITPSSQALLPEIYRAEPRLRPARLNPFLELPRNRVLIARTMPAFAIIPPGEGSRF